MEYRGCVSLLSTMDAPGTWHSQGGQDRMISSIFEGQRDGYFVDLAAAAPIVLSNSRALERDYGWRGLCIEGNDRLTTALRNQRNCTVINTLISSKAANVTYTRLNVGKQGYSRITSTQADASGANVHETLPLDVVLRANNAPAQMDYLSLDVEYHELAVRTRCT